MELTFNDEQTTALLEALGLAADTADVAVILAAIADLAVAENAIAAKAAGKGLTLIDAAQLAALELAAEEGRTVSAAAAKAVVNGHVDTAIREGKLPPARRDHWVKLIEADAAMADVLASAPVVIPVTEAGYGNAVGGHDGAGDEKSPWFR
ncbi:Mu-like prophage I protein [Rhodococcus erythropolis]|uniref:phage protease n=1 Tax=Rhodococcus erythropolis TaxID=1833 RepID=UPI0008772D18|nr:phage protease [Rhodococcus erythropolis]SCY41848.1 Mu-like prophage I protein [Rhodococcus erythropolis]